MELNSVVKIVTFICYQYIFVRLSTSSLLIDNPIKENCC